MEVFVVKYSVQRCVLTDSGALDPQSPPVYGGPVRLRAGLLSAKVAGNAVAALDVIDEALRGLEE